MRPLVPVLGVVLLLPAGAAGAQVRAGVEIGLTRSSDLVRDSIVMPLAVSPEPALSLAARVTGPLADGWHAGALGQVSRGGVDLVEGGTADSLTTLTLWHAAALLERRLTDRLTAEVSVGVLYYAPAARRANIFQEGTPRPLVWGVGIGYAHPLSSRLRVGVRVRYDGHRFNTPHLRAAGFREDRFVHRLSLGISVTGRPGGAQP